MENAEEAGVFLNLNDCMALYPRFKGNEPVLSEEERKVLIRVEKALYGSLSIREMEELLERGSARPGAPGLLCKPWRV